VHVDSGKFDLLFEKLRSSEKSMAMNQIIRFFKSLVFLISVFRRFRFLHFVDWIMSRYVENISIKSLPNKYCNVEHRVRDNTSDISKRR